MNRTLDNWVVWQLADSAFPAGAFAHSAGLEAAVQHGEVDDAECLRSFLDAALWQTGCGILPFFNAVYDDPAKLADLDGCCEVFLSNHVANRSSRAQGRAFLNSARQVFRLNQIAGVEHGHLAPVFGAVTRALSVERATAGELFMFQSLRGIVSAAIRLGIIGPLEGQSLQHALGPRAREIFFACAELGVLEIAQTAPLLEIWQGAQDRLYSRLFQS